MYGYSPKGERCYGYHNWSEKGRINAIGALLGKALLTAVLLTGSVNTAIFTCWVEQDLLPKLPPDSVIVMDNASFHNGTDMRSAIARAGHTLLYLPPYSPDLNEIEKKWAHIKHIRRSKGCSVNELFQHYA